MGVNLQTKVDENAIAKSFVEQFITEKWPLRVLKQNLGITRNTAKTSEKYQALALLIQDTMESLSKKDAGLFGENIEENLQKNPLAKSFAEQYSLRSGI
ncbi:hypothetical protein PF005_g22901 [Phytophthora fragariae]|uniref:Uncharacterized protein n=1 Tax=Phytophthora fragariae TaxID=53985 RepID=A0A6A3IIJ3_9STRA|nr:hypothetical protein PF003_g11983 [Phytophthora fragariae]KAE8928134.1 hypothetical protein PF009_g21712 [Phytophthora fragariae]KAE8981940.1 hypothetical protein PF011_g21827 [Phytophthora fragariae]KAE9080322.1 hypothetical protein PF007_g23090 [Phytophthora fragariae]KAE9080963.1 hypothetical protein PF010_g22185 [Phytophthora fragariae]